jgi:uncharacterized membrane protein
MHIIQSILLSVIWFLIIYLIMTRILNYKFVKKETYNNSKHKILKSKTYVNKKNKDFNTLDDLPYLTNNPTIKIQNNNNTKLLNKSKNVKKINKLLKKNKNIKTTSIKGYNAFPNLKTQNYANKTSIGKKLFIPYNDTPVPINN